jgi:DNA mismatch repair protein MutL
VSGSESASDGTFRGEAIAAWPGAPVARFADLRVIGQAFGGYIVCEAPDALVLVDQHAAHERVRFERLRASGAFDARAAGVPSQRLLVPRVVELEPSACLRLLDASADLAAAGFDIEAFGDRSLLVRAVPAALDVTTDADVLLADLAADLADVGGSERLAAARDALLARIACHGAVRAGAPLVREEMQRILADLDTIPFAATCPHGRPLLAELPRSEIAKRVRRV